MTPEEREAFYDTEIAPALMALCQRCKEAGLPFLALVEWSNDGTGETVFMPAQGAGIKSQMALWAIRSHGNADLLIARMMAHGKERGHDSVFLKALERSGAP